MKAPYRPLLLAVALVILAIAALYVAPEVYAQNPTNPVTVDWNATAKSMTVNWTDAGTCSSPTRYFIYQSVLGTDVKIGDVAATESSFNKTITSVVADFTIKVYCGDATAVPAGRLVGEVEVDKDTSGTYPPSDDATLSALELTGVTLSPAFASATTEYTAAVDHSVWMTAVTATKNNSNAADPVISLNGTEISGGVALPKEGENVITVTVTAQDGNTTETYTVTVTRNAPEPADLRLLWETVLTVGSNSAGTIFGYNSGSNYGSLSDRTFTYEGTAYSIFFFVAGPHGSFSAHALAFDTRPKSAGFRDTELALRIRTGSAAVTYDFDQATQTGVGFTRHLVWENTSASDVGWTASGKRSQVGLLEPDDGEAPSLDIATVDGATLTLEYDEPLDGSVTLDPDVFTVTVAGSDRDVTAASVGGDTVTLTLASAVNAGEAVTVSYTKPTHNFIRDQAYKPAANLVNEVPRNSSGDTANTLFRLSVVNTADQSAVDIGSFASGTTSYTGTVAYAVTEIAVRPVPTDKDASVVVNLEGVADEDGTVSLSQGQNAVAIVVTPEDGTSATQTYTVTVTRADPDIVRAYIQGSNVLVRWKDNDPDGCTGDNYKVYLSQAHHNLWNEFSSYVLTNYSPTNSALMVPAGWGSKDFDFGNIGTAMKTEVWCGARTSGRNLGGATAPRGPGRLTGVTLSGATLTPGYNEYILDYDASVPHDQASATVTYDRLTGSAQRVNFLDSTGQALTDADPDTDDFQVDIGPGETVFSVRIWNTNNDGESTYTFTVTRRSIVRAYLKGGTVLVRWKDNHPGGCPGGYNVYSGSPSSPLTSAGLVTDNADPTVPGPLAVPAGWEHLEHEYSLLVSGVKVRVYCGTFGARLLGEEVLAPHGRTKLYNLSLSGATLMPGFSQYITEYQASAPHDATRTTVTFDYSVHPPSTTAYLDSGGQTLADADGMIDDFQVDLTDDQTVFSIRVSDNPTFHVPVTYTFTVTKQKAPELTGLTVNPGTLTPAFAAATTAYTVPDVGYGDHRITINATAASGVAVSFLDGADMALADADTSPSAPGHQVDLDPGDNSVKVRATKGTATQDYILTITRARPTVSIAAGAATADEGETPTFTVSRGTAADDDLAVTLNVTETGGDMVDAGFEGEHTVTIAANRASVMFILPTTGDDDWEEHSTATVTVAAKDHYTVATAPDNAASVQVRDDDFPDATFDFTGTIITASEDSSAFLTARVRIAGDMQPHRDAGTITVRTTDGAAVAGTDYDGLDTTLNVEKADFTRQVQPGNVVAWIALYPLTVQITDDSTTEPDETFTATLTASDSKLTVSPGRGSATVTITDDDDPPELTDLTVSEGTLHPAFAADTLEYAVTGIAHATEHVTITPTPESGATVSYLDASDVALDDADSMATGHQAALEDGPNTVKVRVTKGTETQDYTVVLVRRSQINSVTITIQQITGGLRYDVSWDDAGVCAPTEQYRAELFTFTSNDHTLGTAAATGNSISGDVIAQLILLNRAEVWCGPLGTGRKVGEVAFTDLGTTHSPARDATLSSLALSPVDVSNFAAGTTEYEVDVASSVAAVTITHETADSNASVAFFDADAMALDDADAMNDDHQVTLAEGANVIKVKVTAPDIRFTETYTLTVTRAPPSIVRAYVDGNNLLVRWKDNDSGGCAGDDYKVYSGADASFTAALQSDEAVTWTNTGLDVPSGWGGLEAGFRVVTGAVRAEVWCGTRNGVDSRKLGEAVAPHGNARLRDLALSGATLAPTFNEYVPEYAATVLDTATQTTISHDSADSAATVSYLDSSNNALADADTSAGATGFQVSLTADETVFYARIVGNTVLSGIPLLGSSIYKFTVTKQAPQELTGLTVNPGTLTPAFAAATTAYTVPDIDYATTRITINATPEAGAAVSFLDGDDMALADADTSPSAPGHQVDLDPGDNTVKVRVTKGTNSEDYTLVITRAKPTVSVTADAAEAGEGDAVTFTVSRGSAAADALAVTVNVSEDSDLVPAANEGEKTVNITANSSSATLTVQTDAGDSVWEEHSTITAAVAAKDHYTVSTTNGSATTLVKDDDFPTATATAVDHGAVGEGRTSAENTLRVEVLVSGDMQPHRDAGTVRLVSSGGTATAGADYTAVDRTFNVRMADFRRFDIAGDVYWSALYEVPLQITDDTTDEDDETFTVALTATDSQITVDSGSVSKQISLKDNDDPPSLSIGDATVDEGSDLVFMVALSAASAKTVTVMYGTSGGSATQGADYTARSGTLTFTPSVTSQTITVETTDDTDEEDAETFTVTLTSPSNATIGDDAATGTIRASDQVLDTTAPQPTITLADSAPSARDFKLNISFGEAVTGFDTTDIELNDAWLIEARETLEEDPNMEGDYSVPIVPSPDVAGLTVALNLTIAAGAVTDTATPTANASLEGTLELEDVYTGPATFIYQDDATDAGGEFEIWVTFLNNYLSGRPVEGFTETDITVANGTVTAFEKQPVVCRRSDLTVPCEYGDPFTGAVDGNISFTATITPSSGCGTPCEVEVDVARGVATSAKMTRAYWDHLYHPDPGLPDEDEVDPGHTPRPNFEANTLTVRRESTVGATYVRALALYRAPTTSPTALPS